MVDPRRASRAGESRSARRRIPVRAPEEEAALDEAEGVSEILSSDDETGEEICSDAAEALEDAVKLQERLLRLQAEFDNYRKRQARDFQKLCSQGKRDLIQELLAVLDNYHRAEQLRDEGDHPVKEIAEGLFRTSEQLTDILRQEGLQPLDVKVDDPFDPNFHEAMLAEDREDIDRETILEVFQKGYTLENELLRPARVKVGRPLSGGKVEASGSEEEAASNIE